VQLDDKVIFDAADRLNPPPRSVASATSAGPRPSASESAANLLYGYRSALIENELFMLGHVAEVEITPVLERNVTTLRR
jgi:hypothetical protein